MPIPCFSGAPGPCTLETLRFDNSEVAKAWGIEVAAGWVVSEYWKLDGAYTYMHVEVEDRAGVPLTSEGGTTPDHQLRLSSLINLPWNLEFDTTFYWIGELPAQVHLHDTPTSVGIDAYE
jgi:outer membrane receptor for ferrienterochelin and colicin